MGSLIAIILISTYGFGIYKFWQGFDQTNFNRDLMNKLALSAFWPALVIVNKSYRKNFTKALKSSK